MTPEQKQQRIAEIEARQPARAEWQYGKDIDFLLFLVKEQEAGDSDMDKQEYSELWRLKHKMEAEKVVASWKARIGQGVKYEQMEADIAKACENASLAMRSACVEKVKAMGEAWLKSGKETPLDDFDDASRQKAFYDRSYAANQIAKELETLSIEQPKE